MVDATLSSLRARSSPSRAIDDGTSPARPQFIMQWSDLRRDAPFFGVMFAIVVTALALTVATVSLITRM